MPMKPQRLKPEVWALIAFPCVAGLLHAMIVGWILWVMATSTDSEIGMGWVIIYFIEYPLLILIRFIVYPLSILTGFIDYPLWLPDHPALAVMVMGTLFWMLAVFVAELPLFLLWRYLNRAIEKA